MNRYDDVCTKGFSPTHEVPYERVSVNFSHFMFLSWNFGQIFSLGLVPYRHTGIQQFFNLGTRTAFAASILNDGYLFAKGFSPTHEVPYERISVNFSHLMFLSWSFGQIFSLGLVPYRHSGIGCNGSYSRKHSIIQSRYSHFLCSLHPQCKMQYSQQQPRSAILPEWLIPHDSIIRLRVVRVINTK